jgi:hypothetical protein
MQNKLDRNELEQLIKRAYSRPRTVAGRTFRASVAFKREPFGALDEDVAVFALSLGDTLAAHGNFVDCEVKSHRSCFDRAFP